MLSLPTLGHFSSLACFIKYIQSIPINYIQSISDRTTAIGQMISAYLANAKEMDDKAVHLLFSANRWEKRALMESKLRSDTSLIVDRCSHSGVAFSSAKGLDIEWCKAPEAGLIAPDLVLYLEVPPEKAVERGGYGAGRYEKLEFQKKVAEYHNMLNDPSWEVINGCLPLDVIEDKLRGLVLDCITSCQKREEREKISLDRIDKCRHSSMRMNKSGSGIIMKLLQ